MEISIKALEQIASPLEIINLLGKPLHKCAKGYYTTICPKCESKLYALDKELVCENNSCTFRAGSVVDYLMCLGGHKWEDVIAKLDTILNGRMKNSVIYKNKEVIGTQLKQKRKLFDFFLRIGLQGGVNNMGVIQYRNSIKSQGIDVDNLRWSIFICGDKESQELSRLVNSVKDGDGLKLTGTNIILPYFANHHTVSHIVVLKSPTSKPDKVAVMPHRISYFGLMQRHPTCEHTKLAYSYADAAKLNTQYARVQPENVCLHMLLDATSDGMSFVPPAAEYVITDEAHDNIRAVSIIQRYVPKLDIDRNKFNIYQTNESISAGDYVVARVLEEVKAGRSIRPVLELMDLSASARHTLLTQLHANRFFKEAEDVRSFFKTMPILTDDKATLFSTPTGYTIKRSNSSIVNYVSNFTIDLEHNLVFAESTDIFHAGNVMFNGGSYQFVVKQDELERVSDLEKAVRRSAISTGSEIEAMPTIRDRGAAKYITTYLRDQISSLPRSEGIPMLGWSPRRTSFYAPTFIADKRGTRTGKKYFHPSVQVLNNYSNDIDKFDRIHQDLPEDIVNVLNQAATFITRSYLSMPVRPIAIYNSAEARNMLSALFSNIGQVTAIQLNNNIRGEELSGVRGFPYYAVGYSYAQTVKSGLSAFILCDNGINIDKTFAVEDLDKGSQALKFIIHKAAEWALNTEAANFRQINSVSRYNSYSVEGAGVILDSCGLSNWPSSKTPYENLDKMLSSIKFDEVKQFFVKDINRHILQIKKEALEGLDQDAVTKELGGLVKTMVVNKDGIDVDSESMMDALNVFYHNAPTVTELFDGDALIARVL